VEINAAYALVRYMIDSPLLQRVSLKDGILVLTFISPQVGQRFQEKLADLTERTGYPIGIYPHPDQNAILQIATRLMMAAGWTLRKGPGLNTASGQVLVKLKVQPTPEVLTQVSTLLEQETGYTLLIQR
jgi:hypothetical protein